jgi:hypothetical protein
MEPGRSAPARLRKGAPKRAQASGGAVDGGCRRSRGWAGVSLSGEEGAVFQPATVARTVGLPETETSAAEALWQVPTQLQEPDESVGTSP